MEFTANEAVLRHDQSDKNPMTKILMTLLLLAGGAAEAAPAVNRFYGYAYDLKSNKYLYTEVHEQHVDGDRWFGGTIKYYAPDGAPIASKTLDFHADPFIPVFRLDIPKEGYVEAITEVGKDSFKMLKTNDGNTRTATVQKVPGMAADSGFHNAIVAHFDELRAGKTLKFKFAVAGQLDVYSFRCRKTGDITIDGKPGMKLLIEPDSLLRLLAGPLDVVYDVANKHLLDYRGTSNMHDPATGKAYNAHIIYPDQPPKDAPKNLPPLQ